VGHLDWLSRTGQTKMICCSTNAATRHHVRMNWLNGSRRKDLSWKRVPLSQDAFAGKRLAVIGGTNGIGRAIALELVAKGAEVTVLGRTFLDEGVAGRCFMQADLAKMTEAQRAAREVPAEKLDMLIFTNGILAGKQRLAGC
jgi:5,10-methylene-tetrahydrofolate dehydrogenase/methenyl tetrahydrofolate cyclohydrolase